MWHDHRLWLLVLTVGLGVSAAPKAAVPPSCGAEPEPLPLFDPRGVACWDDAAAAPGAIGYKITQVEGRQRTSAASWAELRNRIANARGPIGISLSGRLEVSKPLVVNKKSQLLIAGPAEVVCTDEGTTAFVITRSTDIILQDLTITGCATTAIVINATSAQPTLPITQSGAPQAPGTSAAPATTATAPDVILRRIRVSDSSGDRGAGVSVTSARVAVDTCEFSNNIADGCGAGVYADGSSLLILQSSFTHNLGNNTASDDICRGGALHAQDSWLTVSGSSFVNNSGVNGSAVLLVHPVGVGQLSGCTFEHNHQRAGVSQEFSSSSGAVSVLGTGQHEPELSRGSSKAATKCTEVTEGLAVVQCSFSNNTAALTGGLGGSLGGHTTFLAVINSTIIGTKRNTTVIPSDITSSRGAAGGRFAYQDIVMSAYTGGCLSLETSSLLVSGSSFSHCNARFVGGCISTLAVTMVLRDSTFSNSYADMGGCIRATNGVLQFSNITAHHCRGLSSAAGIYMESNDHMDAHLERINVSHCSLTGRGGGMLVELVEDEASLVVSLHDSSITHNTGTYGGGFCMYSATHGELRNNLIAHNTALKFGGGMECATFFGNKHEMYSVNNTWLNNTALIRGGGAVTHPCDITIHEDRFLGNRAEQEGGGFMVYGGKKVVLQHVQVSCNAAQNGGGLSVKMSDSSDASNLDLRCSNVTANGGLADQKAQANCLAVLAAAATGRGTAVIAVIA